MADKNSMASNVDKETEEETAPERTNITVAVAPNATAMGRGSKVEQIERVVEN